MDPIVMTKDGKVRIARTPSERVQLKSEGYAVRTAPGPVESDDNLPPLDNTPVPISEPTL